MLNKNKNNDIHGLIMDQLADVENTLVALEGFVAAATAEGATVEPLRALCKTVREKEHIADVSLRIQELMLRECWRRQKNNSAQTVILF